MNKFTKEKAQMLANKFADSGIDTDDVYIELEADSPNFFNHVSIIKDVLNTEQFSIVTGVYRKKDNVGYKRTKLGMKKEELILYLTSDQGVEEIEKALKELLDKAIYMD
jgi:hypothetical protein